MVHPLDLGDSGLCSSCWGVDDDHRGRVEACPGNNASGRIPMMDSANLYALLDPEAAFIAGVVASMHCVGMCGPLSCALISKGSEKRSRILLAHSLYHSGRLVSYAFLGALAGLFGSAVVSWFGENPARFSPWGFVAFFVAMALGLDRLVTRWQTRLGWGRSIAQRAYRISGTGRGIGLGLATPLIPCGPLYLMLWVTTMSGSALDGTIVMAAFAAGTAPLLLLAQSGWTWLSFRVSPQKLLLLRRVLAVFAIAAICARAFLDTGADALIAGDSICN